MTCILDEYPDRREIIGVLNPLDLGPRRHDGTHVSVGKLYNVLDHFRRNIVKLAVPAKKTTKAGIIDAKLNMIPYYAWNNRGEKSMIVWTPTSEEMATKYIKSDKSPYGDVEITDNTEGGYQSGRRIQQPDPKNK